MIQKPSPLYVFDRSFDDFDELADHARLWDLNLRQLDRGSFQGRIIQFGTSQAHVAEAKFGRKLQQKGSPPDDLRTIAVPADPQLRIVWRGMHVTGNDLMIFPRGSELASVSGPDFHVFTCSFAVSVLSQIASDLGLPELDGLSDGHEVVCCSPAAIASLRRFLHKLTNTVAASDAARALSITSQVDDELPRRLLGAIATSSGSRAIATSRRRELALIRAEEFIERHAGEDISIRDICRAAKVSQRTLEYAFEERFGVTPKSFLAACRLNAVRRRLRRAEPTACTVTEIANDYGFWHMGQFAADYRRRFEELPSATLRRNSTVV